MRSKDGGDIDAALLAERYRNTCQPLVELDNNGSLLLVVDILADSQQIYIDVHRLPSYLAQEPCNEVSKDDGLVSLRIARRRGNTGGRPEVALPLVKPPVAGTGVEEKHTWGAVNQPASVQHLDAALVHGLDGSDQSRVLGLNWLYLNSGLIS